MHWHLKLIFLLIHSSFYSVMLLLLEENIYKTSTY